MNNNLKLHSKRHLVVVGLIHFNAWLINLFSAFVYFTNVKTELTFGAICKRYSVFK